jgi:hypothetical protein
MPYFSESDGKLERIGKVIGDAFSAFIILALIAVFIQSMTVR